MSKEKRHKKVIRQRIIAFFLTILVLGGISYGGYRGVLYLQETGFFERVIPKPAPKPVVKTTKAQRLHDIISKRNSGNSAE